MRKTGLIIVLLILVLTTYARKPTTVERPKLVVGIIIDQMRWDYLYRYYGRFGEDGFRRLLNEGYNCQNTMVNYLPTYTAPGHACVYTGSVPAIHGIAGNNWFDSQTGKPCYCVDDASVYLANDTSKAPSYSPRNMLTTTVTDELRLATNSRSRVFGVAIKDRGAILPAGHAANAAYWYDDKTGGFVTSTYYDKKYQDPAWLRTFNNNGNFADSLVKLNWTLTADIASYTQSTKDATPYEGAFKGETAPVFPHLFNTLSRAARLRAIKAMPAGNTLALAMASACVAAEQLGKGTDPDFLCVSLSSPDYVGHQFAPNAVETEDMYMKLDRELASFMSYLDEKVGKGNYLLFLTADHAGAHNPQFLKDANIPAGIWHSITKELNSYLKERFKRDQPFVTAIENYQVVLNDTFINNDPLLHRAEIKASVRDWLLNAVPKQHNAGISFVLDMEEPYKTRVPEPIMQMAINGYNRTRSGCLQIILEPGWFESEQLTGTTHGSWNPYDAHIPLLWYGWHIPQGETHSVVNMTDIAPTVAALLHIQMPNGCIGKPITEIVK